MEPIEDENTKNPFMIPSKLYNFLKQLALIGLPAVSTFYFMLGETWEWDNTTKVIGTIAAIQVFLGAILGLSSRAYNKSDARFDGDLIASENEDGNKTFLLDLKSDPEELPAKKQITFKVKNS
jgi:hypothetical protein